MRFLNIQRLAMTCFNNKERGVFQYNLITLWLINDFGIEPRSSFFVIYIFTNWCSLTVFVIYSSILVFRIEFLSIAFKLYLLEWMSSFKPSSKNTDIHFGLSYWRTLSEARLQLTFARRTFAKVDFQTALILRESPSFTLAIFKILHYEISSLVEIQKSLLSFPFL